MQAIDTGTFMHEVIDRFFHLVRERQLEVKQLEESQIYSLVQEVIEEKLAMPKNYIFTSTPKYKALTNRLKKVVTTSMKYILESLKNSDFEVFGNELEFKKGKAYEPIILEIEDGKKVEITGKIDRVDMAKTPDGTYIRIIDYKSSVKSMDLNNVIAGLQIQLLTYLDATCKIEEVMPAGVLYFSLIDPLIKTQKAMSQEEMEEELKKKFKMQGLILADVKVIRMIKKER
jgi:ATP-dependent helicase/nuclease subunit B